MTDRSQDGERSSVWNRLRRRKVVQWGLAYAAGAWGLLQGLQFVTEAFGWPSRMLKLGAVAAMLGLPLALALAWFRGERGAQRVTRAELAVVTSLFLIGGGLFWYYHRTSAELDAQVTTQSAPPSSSAATAPPADRSIAVLPFVNMSPDAEQAYFADGIAEELLNLLAKVPELRVIARTSSFAFKGKDVGIAEIAQQLNVTHVLEGSVRRSGDTLRITAQLIRTSDSSHLWSGTYDRQMTDVFKVQDEIAGAVVAELKVKLLGAAPTATRADPMAYPLLLEAKALADRGTPSDRVQAVALYKEALAIEPAEARAWAGLGRIYFVQAVNGEIDRLDGARLAREVVDRALTLDPRNSSALALRARIASDFDLDLPTAARYLQQALEADSGNLAAINNAATLLEYLGRIDEAVALYEYRASRDPVNAAALMNLATAYARARRWDDAIAAYRALLQLSPSYTVASTSLGEALLIGKGDAAGALAACEADADSPWRTACLVTAFHALGRSAESRSALKSLIDGHLEDQPLLIASTHASLGDGDAAFAALDRAALIRDPSLASVLLNPSFDRVRDDPRWQPFLRKVGFAPEQLARIEFKVTLPQ
ncbi:MAG: tetratricopeptide repeat protein [Steroidobacteraceae bacterium]|nr:tetratricopeptide repeat protein [Steroidobacteraceae bacterium]